MEFGREYVGMELFALDDDKIGDVKNVTSDGQYLVIDRTMAKDCAVPISAVEHADGRLVLQYRKSFLDDAPSVDIVDDDLTIEDRRRLDDYYLRRAA
jgi:hypothetical protein